MNSLMCQLLLTRICTGKRERIPSEEDIYGRWWQQRELPGKVSGDCRSKSPGQAGSFMAPGTQKISFCLMHGQNFYPRWMSGMAMWGHTRRYTDLQDMIGLSTGSIQTVPPRSFRRPTG